VARIVGGPSHVIGAVVTWGASMTEPGVYDRTSAGGFVVGRIDGNQDPRVDRLAAILEALGPVSCSDNLLGARWSKLAINCAISSLGTVGGDRLGVLMRRRFVRRLALEIMTETVHVAHADRVRLEKVSGTLDLDWLALTASERRAQLGSHGLFAKHALLLAVGTRYRRLRSSMLSAIERGREPSIDFLNGEVTTRGVRHNVATPVNDAVVRAVKRMARGEQQPGISGLESLFVETGSLRGSGATRPAVTPSEAPPPMRQSDSRPPPRERPDEPT
jgi:2-dehydropantoate 2-reductase